MSAEPPRFPDGGGAWFTALACHMDKAWYDAHKAEYQRLWAAPMAAVLAAVAEALQEAYPVPLAAPKVHRIHNDRRFREGPPYKTHSAGYLGLEGLGGGLSGGAGPMAAPVALHLSYGSEQHVGAGVPVFADKGSLARWRAAVVDPVTGAELEGLLAEAEAQGLLLQAFSTLKQGPAGLRDHPRVELLKLKGLILTAPPPEPTSPELVAALTTLGRRCAPVVRWLARNVTGPAGESPARSRR